MRTMFIMNIIYLNKQFMDTDLRPGFFFLIQRISCNAQTHFIINIVAFSSTRCKLLDLLIVSPID